jgi:hypothetical protein
VGSAGQHLRVRRYSTRASSSTTRTAEFVKAGRHARHRQPCSSTPRTRSPPDFQGNVYVGDRGNARVQVSTTISTGRRTTRTSGIQWAGVRSPGGPGPKTPAKLVPLRTSESWPGQARTRGRRVHGRIYKMGARRGHHIGQVPAEAGKAPGEFRDDPSKLDCRESEHHLPTPPNQRLALAEDPAEDPRP